MTDPAKSDPDGIGKSGRIGANYDPRYHNAYRLYDEDKDINQFRIHLELTGEETDDDFQVSAKVFQWKARKRGGELEQLGATRDIGVMKDGDDFTIDDILPKPLKVEKSGTGCGTYTFTYGSKDDGNSAFRFRSDDKSVLTDGKFVVTQNEPSPRTGQYCVPRRMEDVVQPGTIMGKGKGKGKGKDKTVLVGTRLECSFPGW